MGSVPIIDLEPWYSGEPEGMAAVAAQVDEALQRVGFFLVTGHGVTRGCRAGVRIAARSFFELPDEVKEQYAVTVGGRGWLPPGVEANGFAEGTVTPPDLKESYSIGADRTTDQTGDPETDDFWFADNVWPSEIPWLEPVVGRYLEQMQELAQELLKIAAVALGAEPDLFTRQTERATHTLNINRYPSMDEAGEPEPGQFRIGPHTDFGTFTVLDRQPGKGGLQVWSPDGEWEDAPFHPDAFTINTGDLLARWSGDRWISNRHRVLPPQAEAPDEDLVSLVYFHEADHDAEIVALQPPLGRENDHEPVTSSVFLKKLLDAITVG
ncbi:isopenicillin N synthase family oxygenase [Nakamurella sp. YIM 132087]|uniref:Isopenicillin N synthase family oxygenase n=1 Tax=Nakamurella alba TaxID=2665158 RepID=A0A7K1FJI6_9ACTN|nr:2-oxoglutarate and iron-dependent oxygenase domain-containing protein [Nakamurella alba]MTD14295.1 isopenicillin N synthase family oxygenase [Nakamurella alba]